MYTTAYLHIDRCLRYAAGRMSGGGDGVMVMASSHIARQAPVVHRHPPLCPVMHDGGGDGMMVMVAPRITVCRPLNMIMRLMGTFS